MPPTDLRWERLATGSSASLRGLSAPGGGIVWASGSSGTVLRSLDHGATWTPCGLPGDEAADLRDIEAVDADTAYAITITAPARVVKTSDAGRTWRVLFESDDKRSFYDSIALLDDGGGIVFGDPRDGVFEVLRSSDRENWQRVPATALPIAREGEAAFAASGTCVVAHGKHHAWIGTGGMSARVLRTSDGGRTWSAAETPMIQGEATTGIYSVAFLDDQRGIVVGGDYTTPDDATSNAAVSVDGGASWTAVTTGLSGYRSAVAFVPGRADVLVAVGRAGCDWSSDGGRSWRPFAEGEGYYALAFAPDGEGYAVGAGGRAARLVVTN